MRKNGLCNLFSHCGIYRKIVTIRRKFLYMPAQAGMVMEATSPVLVTDTVAECQSSGGKARKHRLPKTNLKPLCTSIGPGQATVLILNGPEPYVAALLTKTMASRPLSDAAYLPVMPRRVNWTLHVSLNLRPWHGHVQGALPVPLYSWLSPKASPAPESPAWCKNNPGPLHQGSVCCSSLAAERPSLERNPPHGLPHTFSESCSGVTSLARDSSWAALSALRRLLFTCLHQAMGATTAAKNSINTAMVMPAAAPLESPPGYGFEYLLHHTQS